MSSEQNKLIVRRYLEQIWGRNDRGAALELIAHDYVDHNPPPGVTPDRQGLLVAIDIFAAAFPDAILTVDDLVAEGETLADRWTLRGTQRGAFFGIPPSGKQVILSGMDFHRLADGKISDTWHVEDISGLLRQIRSALK